MQTLAKILTLTCIVIAMEGQSIPAFSEEQKEISKSVTTETDASAKDGKDEQEWKNVNSFDTQSLQGFLRNR